MKVTTLTEYLNFKTYNNLRDKLIEQMGINVFDKLNVNLQTQVNSVNYFNVLSNEINEQIKKQLVDDYINVLSINKSEKKELIDECGKLLNKNNLEVINFESFRSIDIRIKVKLAKIIFNIMEKNNVSDKDYESMLNILSAVLYYPLEMDKKEPKCKRKKIPEVLDSHEQ